jgi:flagellar motor switch protein FliM
MTVDERPAAFQRPPYLAARGAATAERAPLLGAVAEAVPAPLALALQQVAGVETTVADAEHAMQRLAVIVERCQIQALAAVFTVSGWEAPLIALLHRPLIDSLLETALGGAAGPSPQEPRLFTALETSFVRLVAEAVAPVLQEALALTPGAPRLSFSHVEKRLALLDDDRKAGAAALMRFQAALMGRGGALEVVVPSAALPRFRAAAGAGRADTARRDPLWMSHLKDEVGQTAIEIRALIRDNSLTLGDVARMKPGQVLRLDAPADARVLLESQGKPLFWCDLGRDGRNLTVRLESRADEGAGAPGSDMFENRDRVS